MNPSLRSCPSCGQKHAWWRWYCPTCENAPAAFFVAAGLLILLGLCASVSLLSFLQSQPGQQSGAALIFILPTAALLASFSANLGTLIALKKKRGHCFRHHFQNCHCTRCGFVQHTWKNCACIHCGAKRDLNHTWKGCRCTTCLRTRDEQHTWQGCRCSVCGKTREHVYQGCKCINCGAERHHWDGCVCLDCGKVVELSNSRHNWNGCKCTRCGSSRDSNHILVNCHCTVCKKEFHSLDAHCQCTRCGGTFHNWIYRGSTEDKISKYCRRCGKSETEFLYEG